MIAQNLGAEAIDGRNGRAIKVAQLFFEMGPQFTARLPHFFQEGLTDAFPHFPSRFAGKGNGKDPVGAFVRIFQDGQETLDKDPRFPRSRTG
jgi:hypothetical protein